MAIEDNYLHRMSVTNIDNIETMDFVLNLDLLNGCVHTCEGCYVNKRNNSQGLVETLDAAYEVAKNLTDKGLRFRELILGPTDFFSASNTLEILGMPSFQRLMHLHEKTRITAACIFDNINKDHFQKIFDILDDKTKYRREMILEFVIPLNSKKIIGKESQYMADNKWALDFFGEKTPKVIDWSYAVNIHQNENLKKHYTDVVQTIKEEFNTIVEFNPGFFRSNNRKVIDTSLSYWKKFLQDILTEENFLNMNLTNVGHYHNTGNTICLNFYKGGIYFSPFIYEQIVDTHESFKVIDKSAENIMNQHTELQVSGFNYSEKTTECGDCRYLTACVGRNVLNYMENKEMKDCLFPEIFKDLGTPVKNKNSVSNPSAQQAV